MLEIFRCKRKASNIEPLKAIIGNFYWGFSLTPQGNFLELTGGVEKLTGVFNPATPPTIQSLMEGQESEKKWQLDGNGRGRCMGSYIQEREGAYREVVLEGRNY